MIYAYLYMALGLMIIHLIAEGANTGKICVTDMVVSALIGVLWPITLPLIIMCNYGDTVIWSKKK